MRGIDQKYRVLLFVIISGFPLLNCCLLQTDKVKNTIFAAYSESMQGWSITLFK